MEVHVYLTIEKVSEWSLLIVYHCLNPLQRTVRVLLYYYYLGDIHGQVGVHVRTCVNSDKSFLKIFCACNI